MRKTLHYCIAIVIMMLCQLPAMAQDVTIDFTKETMSGGANTDLTHTTNGFTFTATKEGGVAWPRHHSTARDFRIYAKNKLVISSTTAFNQIVFNISKDGLGQWANMTPSRGEVLKVDKEARTATWIAPEPVTSIEFTVSATNDHGNKRTASAKVGQFYFNSVVITKTNETTEIVEAPTFSHPTGNYFEPFNLTLYAPEGYTIYYTIDLSNPTNNSLRYTDPIRIETLTTIKAIAYNANNKKSFDVSHTFTFPALRNSIADMKLLDNNATAKLTLTDAVVLATGNGSMFVADQTGGIMFYKTGFTYEPGTILNGSLICKFTRFQNLPEIIKDGEATNANNLTATSGSKPAAMPVALADIKNENMLCKLVKISGVTLDSANSRLYAVVGEERIEVYNKTLGAIPAGTVLQNQSTNNTLTAIVSIYGNNYQLLPVTLEGLTTGIHEVVAETENATKTAIYNMAGQRVDANYKGIVIKNGKKYLQK